MVYALCRYKYFFYKLNVVKLDFLRKTVHHIMGCREQINWYSRMHDARPYKILQAKPKGTLVHIAATHRYKILHRCCR